MARSRRTNDVIFEESLFNNKQDYDNFLNRLIDLAVGRYTIKNLPKEIYEPYVLRKLITKNEVCFFKDDALGENGKYICYDFVTDAGKLDIYGQTTKRRVICTNGATYTDLTNDNSVVIKGSNSGNTILPIIEQYAKKLYVISRTIDINVNAQKTPVIILCPDEEYNTFNNLYMQYAGFSPFIKGSNTLFDNGSVKAIKTDAPFVADKLYELQSNTWNEYLTFLGIANVSEKKERLISDEVSRSLGGVVVARNNFTRAISRGLEQANEMFGLDMKLLFATDEEANPNEPAEDDESGAGDYE